MKFGEPTARAKNTIGKTHNKAMEQAREHNP